MDLVGYTKCIEVLLFAVYINSMQIFKSFPGGYNKCVSCVNLRVSFAGEMKY